MLNTSPAVREPASPSGSGTKKDKESEWDLKEKSQEKGLSQPPQVRRTHKPHRNPVLSLRVSWLSVSFFFSPTCSRRLSKGLANPSRAHPRLPVEPFTLQTSAVLQRSLFCAPTHSALLLLERGARCFMVDSTSLSSNCDADRLRDRLLHTLMA